MLKPCRPPGGAGGTEKSLWPPAWLGLFCNPCQAQRAIGLGTSTGLTAPEFSEGALKTTDARSNPGDLGLRTPG